jgi:hypothetical protein
MTEYTIDPEAARKDYVDEERAFDVWALVLTGESEPAEIQLATNTKAVLAFDLFLFQHRHWKSSRHVVFATQDKAMIVVRTERVLGLFLTPYVEPKKNEPDTPKTRHDVRSSITTAVPLPEDIEHEIPDEFKGLRFGEGDGSGIRT